MACVFEAEASEIPGLITRQYRGLDRKLAAVVARLDTLSPSLFATIARGSSNHAAAFVAYLVGMGLRLPAAALPPSLASVYRTTLRLDRACVLAISQSGESPDVNVALAHARTGGAFTLGLINDMDSALGRIVDVVLGVGAGTEVATAATKSFMLSATAGLHLAGKWGRDATLLAALQHFPDVVASAQPGEWGDALDLFAGADDAFVVGRGPALAIAQELALKLAEVCGIHAQALSAAELLHGPIAIAAPNRPAIVFAGDDRTQHSIDESVSRLLAAGSPVLVLSAQYRAAAAAAKMVPVPNAGHPVLQPLAALYATYPFIADLARVRGRDPDRPPHLMKITRTF